MRVEVKTSKISYAPNISEQSIYKVNSDSRNSATSLTANNAPYNKSDDIINITYANAPAQTYTTIEVSTGVNINVNGKYYNMTDVTGTEVIAFSYGGTTYVPIRAISELYGVNVDWDQNSSSVLLGTSENKDYTSYTELQQKLLTYADEIDSYIPLIQADKDYLYDADFASNICISVRNLWLDYDLTNDEISKIKLMCELHDNLSSSLIFVVTQESIDDLTQTVQNIRTKINTLGTGDLNMAEIVRMRVDTIYAATQEKVAYVKTFNPFELEKELAAIRKRCLNW